MVNGEHLRAIGGASTKAAIKITDQIAASMPVDLQRYGLDQPHRLAMFLAQIAHESAHFKTTTEYASGAAYEGRKDLGNTEKGDGKRFRGRGLIQLTGRENYTKFGKMIGADLVGNPLLAAKFPYAMQTAFAYWDNRRLNGYADKGDFLNVTRKINGGYNGLDDRYAKYGHAALILLGLKPDIKAFQRANALSSDGVVGPQTVKVLHEKLKALSEPPKSAPIAPPKLDPKAVEAALRDDGSRTITATDAIAKISLVGVAGAAVKEALGTWTELLSGVPDMIWPISVVAACAAGYWFARKAAQARVSDAITGKHTGRTEAIDRAIDEAGA